MKPFAAACVCYFFLLVSAHANEKEIIQKTSELYQQGEYTEALGTVDRGIEQFGLTDGLIHEKYKVLLALEKDEDALEIFEVIIERVGDSPDVVIDKVRLLIKLGRYDEALSVAMSVEEKSSGKSPYMSFFIAKIYVALSDKENALEWLAITSDRGDQGFEYLLQDEFKLLHSDARFKRIIEEMKQRAGIGMPATDFTVPLLSGASYTLSQDQGNVVLIDFWATWCPPCVAEVPQLKEIYAHLKERGFEIIGISLDSDREALESFMRQKDLPWRIGFSGNGLDDEVAKLYRVDSAPRYLLVDRKGVVRHAFDMGGKKLEDAIKELVTQ